MPIPAARIDADGSLIAHTAGEVAAFGMRTRGIRDGTSPKYTYNPEATTKTVSHFIEPDQLDSFICWLLGAAKTYFDVGNAKTQLSRLMPQVWPGTTHCVAMDAQVKGFKFLQDDNSGAFPVPNHQYLEVEANYRTVPFDLDGDGGGTTNERFRYVETKTATAQGEYLTLPGYAGYKYLTFDGSPPHGKPIPYNIGRIITSGKIVRKWWRVPKDAIQYPSALHKRIWGNPDTGDRGYIGTVNKYTIHGFKPGMLLFETPELERTFDAVSDDWCYNVTYTWKVIPDLVNHLFSPASNGTPGFYLAGLGNTWYAPGSVPDDTALYNERDHRLLYEVG